MKSGAIRRKVTIGVIVLLACCVCGLGLVRWSIQSGLEKWCAIAQAVHPHPGDDVAALMDYVQSESHSLEQRNYAVWALGQARDSRAVAILESYQTGDGCDHDSRLCEGELDKAIELCKGDGPNLLLIRTP